MKMFPLIRCEFIKNFSLRRLIITLLVLSVCCFGLIKMEAFFGSKRSFVDRITKEQFTKHYEKVKKAFSQEDESIQQGIFASYERMKPIYDQVEQLIGDTNKTTWQGSVLLTLSSYVPQYEALKQLVENYQSPIIQKFIESERINDAVYDTSVFIEVYYFSTLKRYFDSSIDEIIEEEKFLEQQLLLLEQSLQENAYYLVEQFSYNQEVYEATKRDRVLNRSMVESRQYIIKNKIKDENDYQAVNAKQYRYLFFSDPDGIPTVSEYRKGYVNKSFDNYASTKRYYQFMKKEEENQRKIVKYAMDHHLKHDYYLGDEIEDVYLSSKNFMNLGLHLGIVILFLSAIYHAGIVAWEHDKGTVKLLLTKPIRRGKILLSKVLYLILETYLLWIIGSFLLFLMVGFLYGFGDLFTSKLVISHGNVVEINYWLWYLKELFICGIPICCFQIVLFSLSALTLNTSFTASVISILTVFSLVIWFLISQMGFTFLDFLSYTPIPYLDYWFVRYSSRVYLEAIVRIPVFANYGLIIGGVVAFFLLFLTLIIYKKRDIKN